VACQPAGRVKNRVFNIPKNYFPTTFATGHTYDRQSILDCRGIVFQLNKYFINMFYFQQFAHFLNQKNIFSIIFYKKSFFIAVWQ
jgi:hypothetical protein